MSLCKAMRFLSLVVICKIGSTRTSLRSLAEAIGDKLIFDPCESVTFTASTTGARTSALDNNIETSVPLGGVNSEVTTKSSPLNLSISLFTTQNSLQKILQKKEGQKTVKMCEILVPNEALFWRKKQSKFTKKTVVRTQISGIESRENLMRNPVLANVKIPD
tara:strand:- start:37 stop:522 length:486 start_codon:yes stop_codon:yes gene_type:complete